MVAKLAIAVTICLTPFVLTALVMEGYFRMRDRYMARKRDEAVRDGKVVEFKKRAA